MYKLQIVFDAKENGRFDRDYYVNQHLEFAKKQLAGKVNVARMEFQWGIKEVPRDSAKNLCIDYLKGEACVEVSGIVSIYLENDNELQNFLAFLDSAEAGVLDADIPNFTDQSAHLTFSKVIRIS